MAHDREVAGLRCSQVLALLSDYLDRELPDERRAQVEAHLRGCRWCEEFGGRFATVVKSLREELAADEPPDPAITARLLARLRDEE